jgi:hypothetical protein
MKLIRGKNRKGLSFLLFVMSYHILGVKESGGDEMGLPHKIFNLPTVIPAKAGTQEKFDIKSFLRRKLEKKVLKVE